MKFDLAPVTWQMWSLVALALVMAAALFADLRRHRIPNRLVLLALAGGVLIHLVGPANDDGGLFGYWPGALGAQGALFGALTGLALFLPLYGLRAMGAGDVKLMAGIGSFAGPADALNVTLFILAMGGVVALARMLWAGTVKRAMSNLMLILLPIFHRGRGAFDPATQSVDRMPYSLAMAAGLLAYGAWRWLGGPPPFHF